MVQALPLALLFANCASPPEDDEATEQAVDDPDIPSPVGRNAQLLADRNVRLKWINPAVYSYVIITDHLGAVIDHDCEPGVKGEEAECTISYPPFKSSKGANSTARFTVTGFCDLDSRASPESLGCRRTGLSRPSRILKVANTPPKLLSKFEYVEWPDGQVTFDWVHEEKLFTPLWVEIRGPKGRAWNCWAGPVIKGARCLEEPPGTQGSGGRVGLYEARLCGSYAICSDPVGGTKGKGITLTPITPEPPPMTITATPQPAP